MEQRLRLGFLVFAVDGDGGTRQRVPEEGLLVVRGPVHALLLQVHAGGRLRRGGHGRGSVGGGSRGGGVGCRGGVGGGVGGGVLRVIRSHDPEAAASAAILLFEGLPVDMEGAEPSVMQLAKVSFAAFVCLCVCVRACVRSCVRACVRACVRVLLLLLFCSVCFFFWFGFPLANAK